MIKIGIDPSGTGTTAIAVYEDNKLIEKLEFTNKDWKAHFKFIINYLKNEKPFGKILSNNHKLEYLIFIENCLYTNANGSKDRDDLLRFLGALEKEFTEWEIDVNWVAPRHTKSVVKKIELKSLFLKENPHLNDNFGDIKIGWEKDAKLCYEWGKGWKYNNEKISNHLRDAIIIANYESK